MKKILLTIAAIYCCAMSTESVLAQTTDWNEYFTLTHQVKTIREYSIDNPDSPYDQDSLRAGQETMMYDFGMIPRNQGWPEAQPDTVTAFFSFSDLYGREINRLNATDDVKDVVEELVDFHAFNSTTSGSKSFTLPRGGEYEYWTLFDFLNIDKRDTVTVYDDPSLRVNGTFAVKTGEDFNFAGYYNTGYPYDINSLTGEEYADVTIYKMETDSTGREAFKHRFPLHLKDEAHPLLAGWDSLFVNIIKPEIGPYLMRFETNWDAVATRNIPLAVEDTLRATITLDKDAYNFKSAKQATMHMTMDYGYPHIGAVKPDTIPTIRVTASLFKDNAMSDTLFTDTLKLVSDTLATKDLRYAGDWTLDWTKIDVSKLAQEDSVYYLKATIVFNGNEQYNTTIPLRVETSETAIRSVTVLFSNDEETYTLSGVRVNSHQPLAPGIYIRKGKKIIIK